jgi:uncharacterized protein (TIGR03435 family)
VCALYLESPLECVAGVSGANLKKRIEEIMANRTVLKLNAGRKLLLAGVGVLAVAGPIAVGLMNAPPIRAQATSQPKEAVAFDVVSVKLRKNPGPKDVRFPSFSGGRFTATVPLGMVIAEAYRVPINPSARLSGIPDWARGPEGVYDIDATAVIPAGLTTSARDERVRLMLQALLADRFKLAIHRETKEMAVYSLVVGKGGPKLEKAEIDEKDCPGSPADGLPCHQFNGGMGRGMHARAVSMEDLANYAGNWTDRPLLDKTGIEGLYKIETQPWLSMQLMTTPPPAGAKSESGADLADLPTLFQVFEKLGLKMESTKDKVDVYVIDHIERPSEN